MVEVQIYMSLKGRFCSPVPHRCVLQDLCRYVIQICDAERMYLLRCVVKCLLAKFEECELNVPKVSELNRLGAANCPYTSQQYLSMELRLLQFFRWHISLPTAAHFFEYFFVVSVTESDCFEGRSLGDQASSVMSTMSKYVVYFLEISLQGDFILLITCACYRKKNIRISAYILTNLYLWPRVRRSRFKHPFYLETRCGWLYLTTSQWTTNVRLQLATIGFGWCSSVIHVHILDWLNHNGLLSVKNYNVHKIPDLIILWAHLRLIRLHWLSLHKRLNLRSICSLDKLYLWHCTSVPVGSAAVRGWSADEKPRSPALVDFQSSWSPPVTMCHCRRSLICHCRPTTVEQSTWWCPVCPIARNISPKTENSFISSVIPGHCSIV